MMIMGYYNRKIFILLTFAALFYFNKTFCYARNIEEFNNQQSYNIEQLANDIVDSYRLFEQGKKIYENCDYSSAKKEFELALRKDPDNRKAKEYLKLCDLKMEDEGAALSAKEENKKVKNAKPKKSFFERLGFGKKKTKEEKKVSKKRKFPDAEKKKETDKTKSEKKEKLMETREQANLEKRAMGILGVRKEYLRDILLMIPARNIPKNKLKLEECIKTGMDSSLTLKTAEKQVKLAKIRLWEARRKLAPALKAKWEESSGEIYANKYEGRKAVVEASQPVFHGGELINTVNQANVNLEIVKNDYDRIKNDIILKVEKAYYSLDKAIKFLEVQAKIYDRAKTLDGFIDKGYQSGAISKLEFLNVRSKYNQINFQYISAEEDISLAKLILQQAMNTEEDLDIEPAGEPEIKSDISLDNCYTLAYTNRPEMKINYLMSEYYLYEKKIARSGGWPKLDAMGSYGYSAEDFRDAELKAGHKLGPEWYAGVKVSVPFFGSTLGYSLTREHWQPVVASFHGTDSLTHTTTFSVLDNLKYYSDVTEADIGFERAKEEYNKVKQEISLEVKETFFKYKKAMLQTEVAKSKVEFQRKQVEFLEAKREFDEAPVSNVLEEMVRLGEEEFSLLQSITDYYIAVKSLNKAVGIVGYFDKKDESSKESAYGYKEG